MARRFNSNDPYVPVPVWIGGAVVLVVCFAVLLTLPSPPPVPGWQALVVASVVLLLLGDLRRQPIGQGTEAQVNISPVAALLFACTLLVPAAAMPVLVVTDIVVRPWRHALVNCAVVALPVTATAALLAGLTPVLDGVDPAAEAVVLGFASILVWWLVAAATMTVLMRVVAGIPVRESPVLRREATLVMWSQLLLGLVLAVLIRVSWWYLPLALLAVWWAWRYLSVLRRAVEAEADGRTGLLRYDVLRDAAHREQERSRRAGTPNALVLFDIDELRAVNLGRGYESGDAVITGTAQTLRDRARWQDVAARVGGEEFCVLVTGATVEAARAFAEQVQADVRASTYETPSGPVRVTISAGVTDLRPHEALDEALARLDLALYDAKGAGLDSLRLRLE